LVVHIPMQAIATCYTPLSPDDRVLAQRAIAATRDITENPVELKDLSVSIYADIRVV
jgi:hypothetical protein